MSNTIEVLRRVYRVFASYGLAVFLIALLFLLTLLGTIEQVDHGLYAVQKKYFESLYLVHDFYGVPIPLPGGALVMTLFGINLILGGIVRIRKKKQTIGVLIAHAGMLMMLFGGLVTYTRATTGYVQLYENQTAREFESYYDWAIEIGRADQSGPLLLIPHEQFGDIGADRSRTFFSKELPFEIVVRNFAKNAARAPAGSETPQDAHIVEGYYLRSLPSEKDAERNVAGAYATLRDTASGRESEIILTGAAMFPSTVSWDGTDYTLQLAHARYPLPFAVTLDKFTRTLHPNTQMASSFESEITWTKDDLPQKSRIYMNHPLRKDGFTLFQASWGPQNARANAPLFSVFAVVRNPADQIPLYSCIVVSVGLLLHFTQKLRRHIQMQRPEPQK